MYSTFSRITGREEDTVHGCHCTVVLSLLLATLTIAAVSISTTLPAGSSQGPGQQTRIRKNRYKRKIVNLGMKSSEELRAKTMEKNLAPIKSLTMLIVLVLAAVVFSAHPVQAQASRVCPAPGTGLSGALNMLHDATMWTIPMARDAAQGNAGMFTAVGNSGC